MKKLSIPQILLVSFCFLIFNSCSKTNGVLINHSVKDSTSTDTSSKPSFVLAYLITPLSSDIRDITFRDENGIVQTVYDTDMFTNGKKEMKVSANSFRAWLEVSVGNSTSHPVGFRLQIQVNGATRLAKDFTFPPSENYFTAIAECEISMP
jgi:hypothetical protein